MDIKNTKFKNGMSKEEVNKLISEYITIEDDIYLGNTYKHNWRCKCGNVFKRTLATIKRNNSYDCGCVAYNEVEQRYKYEVEKTSEYEYIRSFRCGDILPNGRVIRSPYIRIKHNHCGSEYVVGVANFIRLKQRCNHCCGSYEKSFAHHIEVELGLKLEDVWDFEKNTVNPYYISKNSGKKVYIKCQNEEVNELNGLMKKDYHGSYEITCAHFSSGKRCSYCKGQYKLHTYDSFGYYNLDKVQSWHPDNDISPFRVARNCTTKFKFICNECGNLWKVNPHQLNRNRWCPVCNMSKGEKRILYLLSESNIEYINDYEYFTDLRGVGGGILRPDFILPNEKIWIEYDGEFHYKDFYKDGEYDKQIYHDKLKDEYAKKHGWKMIRIPYWEFDNIENILEKEII